MAGLTDEKRQQRHITDRVVATVDDACKSRTYHVVQVLSGFKLIPETRKEDEEKYKYWKVNNELECGCSQSDFVAECVHQEAVRKAISGDYDADDRCIEIAEGRAGYDITWFELLDERRDSGVGGSHVLVGLNEIGDELILYEGLDGLTIVYRSSSGTYIQPFEPRTDLNAISSFAEGDHHREEVVEHIEEVIQSRGDIDG